MSRLKSTGKKNKWHWLVLLLIVSAGVAIKFKFVFQESLWPDEALYLYIARNLSIDMKNLTDITGDAFFKSPPLLMYILSLFPDFRVVEFDEASRLLMILMATGTIVTTYLIGKKIYQPIVGFIAAGLLATCPLNNWNGVRILTDGPVVFFIYLAICALVYDKKIVFYIFGFSAVVTKYSALPILLIPLLMKLKPRIWSISYAGLFVSLFVFVASKPFLPAPKGALLYFYHFFSLPNLHHMVEETKFFMGYFLIGFALIGIVLTVKERKYSALFHWVCVFGIFRIFLPWVIFRISRYTMPLYPGLLVFAAYGCHGTIQMVAEKWPAYKKWATLFFVISIGSILFDHAMKSLELLKQSHNTFVGFREAASFIEKQPQPHVVATGSPRQMKYFAPGFDVYDINPGISPDNLRSFLSENQIRYLSIDLWSPHLPAWCKTFDYHKNGYMLIYEKNSVYLFKVLKNFQ